MKGVKVEKINIEGSKPKVCVVSFPMPSALVINAFLYSLVEILEPICEKVYVVTSNIPKDRIFSEKIRIQDVKTAMHFKDTISPRWWSTLLQFFKIIAIQMKISLVLTKISKEIDVVIFHTGGNNLFPCVLMAKILRKKVITSAVGSGSLSYWKAYTKQLFSMGGAFSTILNILEKANFYLSDRIIVESEAAALFLNLSKYEQKLVIATRYIDTNLFQIKKNPKERRNLVGYIGRLSFGKGLMEFVKAIQLILKKCSDIKFLIGGYGFLYQEIKDEVENGNMGHKVELTGWISREELPNYLNELKLLVLPSYSEGLPTIILEAMACGTPVLATSVGAIPDVIKDGENGFILEDTSPECIAENVVRVLEHPDLEEIVKNARKLIEENYTYEVAVNRYRGILNRYKH